MSKTMGDNLDNRVACPETNNDKFKFQGSLVDFQRCHPSSHCIRELEPIPFQWVKNNPTKRIPLHRVNRYLPFISAIFAVLAVMPEMRHAAPIDTNMRLKRCHPVAQKAVSSHDQSPGWSLLDRIEIG